MDQVFALRRRTPRWSVELFESAHARAGRLGPNRAASAIAFAALVSLAPMPAVLVVVASLGSLSAARRMETLVASLGTLGAHAAPLVDEWIGQARPFGALLLGLGLAALVLLAGPLFAAARETLADVFGESVQTEDGVAASMSRRATALLAWVALVSALAASLVLPMVACLGAFALLVAALAIAYRILPPSTLGIGDVLQAALVASAPIVLSVLGLRLLATDVLAAGAPSALGLLSAILLLPFAAARAFVFGATLAAELSERRDDALREQAQLNELASE